MSKVLLIGGSSDLGRAIYRHLYTTHSFTNADIKNENHCPFVQINVTNKLILEKHLNEHHYDWIIHIAGIHPIMSGVTKELMKEVNEEGVRNVLDSIKSYVHHNPITGSKYILISSNSATKNNDFYGNTKKRAEEIFQSYNSINGIILRTRGFTPYHSEYYENFIDYANWSLKGSVHINTVVAYIRTYLNLDRVDEADYDNLMADIEDKRIILADGKNIYTEEELNNWSKETLLKKFPHEEKLIKQLDFSKKPKYSNIDENLLENYDEHGFEKVFKEYGIYKTAYQWFKRFVKDKELINEYPEIPFPRKAKKYRKRGPNPNQRIDFDSDIVRNKSCLDCGVKHSWDTGAMKGIKKVMMSQVLMKGDHTIDIEEVKKFIALYFQDNRDERLVEFIEYYQNIDFKLYCVMCMMKYRNKQNFLNVCSSN